MFRGLLLTCLFIQMVQADNFKDVQLPFPKEHYSSKKKAVKVVKHAKHKAKAKLKK